MGAGEACGTAPSTSIISDVFRPDRRPLALAIYGSALSIAFIVFFPILGQIGEARGWRAMFVAAGAPGMLLALVFLLTVKEPVRGAAEAAPAQTLKPASLIETLRTLLASPAYLALLATAALMGMNVFAASTWTPAFLARVHGLSMGDVASVVGPVRGVCNLAGMVLGGLLMDRLARRGGAGRLTVAACACFLVAPAEILFLLGEPQWAWVAGYAASAFFSLIHQPAVLATVLAVAPVRMRSVASALLLFSSAMLGQSLGPLVVGMLNDALAPTLGPAAIRWSLLILVVTAALAGAVLLLAERLLAKGAEAQR
jgi:predicted MFS family arabinose efflux permease